MLGLRFHPVKERASLKLPLNFKTWSIFPRTKHFSTAMLTRWWTLVPALEKILERWGVSKEYFLEFLPKHKGFEKDAANNKRYERISTVFKRENVIIVQIAFLIDVAIPF